MNSAAPRHSNWAPQRHFQRVSAAALNPNAAALNSGHSLRAFLSSFCNPTYINTHCLAKEEREGSRGTKLKGGEGLSSNWRRRNDVSKVSCASLKTIEELKPWRHPKFGFPFPFLCFYPLLSFQLWILVLMRCIYGWLDNYSYGWIFMWLNLIPRIDVVLLILCLDDLV